MLGVKRFTSATFQIRNPCSRQAIDFLEAFYTASKPETILTHTINDIHQDHRQVGWVSISAFRNAPQLLAYETPRVTQAFLQLTS